MAIDYEHHGDHASVSFSGDLSVEAVIKLIAVVDFLIDTYFYTRVHLIIDSPGGSTDAAAPYLCALARWSAAGVVLCTRVCSRVSSMAAFFFALGDVRIADPSARVFFHAARILEAADITASDTVRMYATLRQLDRTHVKLLAARALRTPPPRPVVADPADRAVVASLTRALALDKSSRASHKARVRALARYVDRAIRARDRRALKALYRALLRLEAHLSPHLVCTLALADIVVEHSPAVAGGAASVDPASRSLLVPEWRALYPPHGAVPRAALTRHVLALGETGSGKSASAVIPLLAAMARAPVDEVRGGLVVDPKRELASVLRALVGDGLQVLDRADLVVDLMATPNWSIAEDLAAKRWATGATQILLRMRGFSPASPLRVLGPHEPGTSNDEFFDREGISLLRDIVAFISMLLDPGAPPVSEWLSPPPVASDDSSDAESSSGPPVFADIMLSPAKRCPPPPPSSPTAWVEALHARARGGDGERGLNIVALADWALGTPLVQVQDDDVSWLWARLARAALSAFGAEAAEARDLLGRVTSYWRKSSEVRAQHMGVIASARNAARDFSAPSVARSVYFGCEPAVALTGGTRVDFARLVACAPPAASDPRFVLYQPERDGSDALVAACLKARFFESVFLDRDRQSGSPALPCALYIADEFQKFATADPTHGEANFLDAARSFGCISVLATQSIASIEHALEQGGGSHIERRSSLEIVLTNTGTKLAFRTTDERTSSRVQELAPYRPGHPPIVRVRPLSGLSVGACYAFLPDGSFRLAQLAPFDPADVPRPDRARAVDHAPERRRRKKRKRRANSRADRKGASS